MTRQEAIEKIINDFCKFRIFCELYPDDCLNEDCEMWWAIEALSKSPSSDLINREDAIDVVHKYFVKKIDKTPHEIDEDGYDVYTDMKLVNALLKHNKYISKALETLPSVDITETKTCQMCQDLTDTILIRQGERIKELEVLAEAIHGWRTGKPTKSGKYMVTLDAWGRRYIALMHYGEPQMPNREIDRACWYITDSEWGDVVYDDEDIFAWMPLPKPYREDSELATEQIEHDALYEPTYNSEDGSI